MTEDTTDPVLFRWEPPKAGGPRRLGFAIGWWRSCPERIGQLALLPDRSPTAVIGRDGARKDDTGPRLTFGPIRPGMMQPEGQPLDSRSLSRTTLLIQSRGNELGVHHVGKGAMRVNGRMLKKVRVEVGDRIALGDELLLLVVERVVQPESVLYPAFPFGMPDRFGLVGESETAWALRRDLAFLASRREHVLIHGPSGVGKEMVARALHGLSARSAGPLVVRSAATMVPDWTAVELFGSARDFPSAGTPERAGLLGEAQGGTLGIDDLDCASSTLQSQLLALLDRNEYHRLGDPVARPSDVRIVAITSRPDQVRRDLASRFLLHLPAPGFSEWREDLPLMVRHFLRTRMTDAEGLGTRTLPGGEPAVSLDLVDKLLEHGYLEGGRELARQLLLAVASSPDNEVTLTPSLEARLKPLPVALPGRDDVEEVLARTGGNVSRAWQELGLSSRHVLNRLMKRYGITAKRFDD